MNPVINPIHSGKDRKKAALHRMYALTACSLAILILGNLAKIPASQVDMKDVISRLNDHLDLLVKVRTAYRQVQKINTNCKDAKKIIELQKNAEIDPLSPLQHACLIPRDSALISDTGFYAIRGTVNTIDETSTSYCGTNMSKLRK